MDTTLANDFLTIKQLKSTQAAWSWVSNLSKSQFNDLIEGLHELGCDSVAEELEDDFSK